MKLDTTLEGEREKTVTRTGLTPAQQRFIRQVLVQIFLLFMLFIVVFPVLWILSMAIDPRGIARPTDLNLFPANANLDAFVHLLREPFSNVLPIYFGDMLMNSLFVALGTSLASVLVGTSAAYAFSRFKFIGRQGGMLVFIILLIFPPTGTLIPLFVLLSAVNVNTSLAALPPALFAGGIVAVLAIVPYRIFRGLFLPDVEARWRINHRVLTIATLLFTFLMIGLTFYIFFDRSPIHESMIETPLQTAQTPLDEATTLYKQTADGAANYEGTVARAERKAQSTANLVTEAQPIIEELTASEDLAAALTAEIQQRQAGEAPEDDDLLKGLLEVQTVLNTDGEESARGALTALMETIQTDATDAAQTLEDRRATLVERQQETATAETALAEAQATYDSTITSIYSLRDQIVTHMSGYVFLAWVGTVIGAGVIWAGVYLLRNQIKPLTLVDLLSWSLAIALLVLFGWENFQWRVLQAPSDTQTLRQTLFGLAIAFASSTLPFTIWNLKGFFDTIPKSLEEAALIDGSGVVSTFFRIMLPLSLPAFAVTILVSFMTGWSEFMLSWVFLIGRTENYTLAMGLATMVNGANRPPPDMQKFAAMSILFSLPILVLFFSFQRFLVSGLTVGAVK